MSLPISYCRDCSAPIIWAETTWGRRMPVDAAPAPSGNLWLEPAIDRAPSVRAVSRLTPAPAGADLRTSHFVSCPAAAERRRKRQSRPKVDETDLYGRGPPSPRRDSLPKSNPAAPPKESNE